MPASPTGIMQGLLKAALGIAILGVALLALLVAWWMALLFIGIWLVYAGLRRFMGGERAKPAARTQATVIDGEYRVEHDAQADPNATPTPQPSDAGPPRA